MYIAVLKKHERKSNFKVVRKLGTKVHHQKSLQSVSTYNAIRAGYTPSRDFRLKKVSTSVSVSKSYQYKKSLLNKYYPDYIMFLLL